MKDKTNYKLLLIPILSSILIIIILSIILVNHLPVQEFIHYCFGEYHYSSRDIMILIFGGWICFLAVYAVLTIASIRLKKIYISFSPLLLMFFYNIFCLIIIPKKNTELIITTILLTIYTIAMIIFEVKISKPKEKAS